MKISTGKIIVELIENNTIIYQEVHGDIDEEDAAYLEQKTGELIQEIQNPDKTLILVNAVHMKKNAPKARKKLIANLSRFDLHKMAVYSRNPIIRALGKFFILASGSSKMQIFSGKEAALQWLKE